GQAVEDSLDVLGINVFAALGDDHVLLAPEELQMPVALKTPEVAGEQPSFDNGLERELRIIEIVRHHRLTARGYLSNSFSIGAEDAEFDAGQRLADRIRAKRFEVVQSQCRACLGQPVAIHDRKAQIIEELRG